MFTLPAAHASEPDQEETHTADSLRYRDRSLQYWFPDGESHVHATGYVQMDWRSTPHDRNNAAQDDLLVRRARTSFEADLPNHFGARLQLDWREMYGNVQDAYLDKSFESLPVALRVGKMKPPLGMERLASGAETFFIERGITNNLTPARDVGVQVEGRWLNERLNTTFGVFRGNADLSNENDDVDDAPALAARVMMVPWLLPAQGDTPRQRLNIGVAGSIAEHTSDPLHTQLPSYRSAGQTRFFAYTGGADAAIAEGTSWRIMPQAFLALDEFALSAEYYFRGQAVQAFQSGAADTLVHQAWQLVGAYTLTGEEANRRGGVIPDAPVLDGGMGAWEAVARVGGFRADADSFPIFANPATAAQEASTQGVGLNWYPSEQVRLSTNYDYTRFEGGNLGPEHALFFRVQLRM